MPSPNRAERRRAYAAMHPAAKPLSSSLSGLWRAVLPRRVMPYAARTHKLLQGLLLYRMDSHDTIAAQLETHARRRPERPFLFSGDRCFTYGEANAEINRHAHAYR